MDKSGCEFSKGRGGGSVLEWHDAPTDKKRQQTILKKKIVGEGFTMTPLKQKEK